jgi:hypothetical protein
MVIATMACQLAGIVTTQVVFWQARAIAAGDHNQVACTCTHGLNGECPMHKKRPAVPDGSSRFCSTTDSSVAFVLTALVGTPAIVADEHPSLDPLQESGRVIGTTGQPERLDVPPALPPPRS